MSKLERAIAAVAELASANACDEFRRPLSELIEWINESHKLNENSENLGDDTIYIADFRTDVTKAAHKLDTALATLQSALSTPSEHSTAALRTAALFQWELITQLAREGAWPDVDAERASFEQGAHNLQHASAWIERYRRQLAPLLRTTNPRGRPTSAFTLFVRKLDRIMRANGGELMLTKVKDEPEWYGTWLQPWNSCTPFYPPPDFSRREVSAAA
jgi:hypothetical protein